MNVRLSIDQAKVVRIAAVLWTILVLVLAVKTLIQPLKRSVFPVYTLGGRDWIEGNDLYTHAFQDVYRSFQYSPLFACLMIPFSVMPPALAGILWRFLNMGAFAGALSWSMPRLFPSATTASGRIDPLAWLLVLPLAVGSFSNGQMNPLVIALLLVGAAATLDQRWNLSAACLSMTFFLKIYPFALGLLLVLLYPRKLAGRLALFVAAGLLLPFLCQDSSYVIEQYQNWAHHLTSDNRHESLDYANMPRDIFILLRMANVHTPSPIRLPLQALAGLSVACLCVIGRLRGTPYLLQKTFTAACCWMLLFGPATESVTFVLIAPALAAALICAWRGMVPARVVPLNAVFGLFLLSAVAGWFPDGTMIAMIVQPYALLLFAIVELAMWLPAMSSHSFSPRAFLESSLEDVLDERRESKVRRGEESWSLSK